MTRRRAREVIAAVRMTLAEAEKALDAVPGELDDEVDPVIASAMTSSAEALMAIGESGS